MTTKAPEATIDSLMAQGTKLTDAIAGHDKVIADEQKERSAKLYQLRSVKSRIVTLQMKEGK